MFSKIKRVKVSKEYLDAVEQQLHEQIEQKKKTDKELTKTKALLSLYQIEFNRLVNYLLGRQIVIAGNWYTVVCLGYFDKDFKNIVANDWWVVLVRDGVPLEKNEYSNMPVSNVYHFLTEKEKKEVNYKHPEFH